MENYYECKKCLYKTDKICNMKGHLNRLKKCTRRNLDLFEFSDEELYNMSLIKHTKNNENEDDNKKFKCDNCNMKFSTNGNLKRHILKSCKVNNNDTIIFNNSNNNIQNITNNLNNITNNMNNITNNMNNLNNITQHINIQFLNSFKNEWSTDHINVNDKYNILKNEFLYKTTLEKILENDKNLNVLIDNEIAYTYKDNKIIPIEIKELIRRIVGKLHTTIYDFSNEIKNSDLDVNTDIIDDAIFISDSNLDDYKNNRGNIQTKAKKMFTNIYDNKRTKTQNIFKKLKNSHLLSNKEDSEFF